MDILVCVKQVPGSSNVKVDEKTGLLIRPKKGNKLNPYDLFAIEAALELREQYGGTVRILTMGPPQAAEALEECLWMGCDEGYLITDRAFGGADVLATSYTISQGIRKTGHVDLIMCGKQTTDGDTAQVGSETAEHLGIPHLSNVTKILSVEDGSVVVEANQENMIVKEKIQMPCLICTDSEVNTPRLPSYRRKKAMDDSLIHSFTLNDFEDKDSTHYGLKGSPTQVQKVFPPEKSTSRVMVEGSSEELAEKLGKLLSERKFI